LGTKTLEAFGVADSIQFEIQKKGFWERLGWPQKKLQIIFVLALAVRLIVCACVAQDRIEPSREHWNFGYETGRIAHSLATGQGFSNPLFGPTGPSAWLAPVYPFVLSGIFRIFGNFTLGSAFAILTFNSICGALTCIPVFFIGKKIFGEATATYAAFGWAFFPYSIYLNAYWVWDVALCTLFLTLLIWFTLELAESRRKLGLRWLGYGAMWGFAALTNPTILAPLPLLSCWAAIRQKQEIRKTLVFLSIAAIAFLFVISPWAIRNYRVFHKPFLLKSNFWLEVTVGNLGSTRHWWNDNQHPSRNIGELQEMMRIGEVNYMEEKKHEALDFIRSHPATYLLLCVRRFVYTWFGFWSPRLEYLVDEPMDPINIVFCTTLSLLAFWGVARSWRRNISNIFPCLGTMFILPIVHYLTHPFVSYRHPIDPEIVLFGAYAAWPVLASEWERSYLRSALAKLRFTENPIVIPVSTGREFNLESEHYDKVLKHDNPVLSDRSVGESSQQQA
jgi:hypothetical protein